MFFQGGNALKSASPHKTLFTCAALRKPNPSELSWNVGGRVWGRTRTQRLLGEHVGSTAAPHCYTYSHDYSTAMHDINHLVIINLSDQGQWGCRTSLPLGADGNPCLVHVPTQHKLHSGLLPPSLTFIACSRESSCREVDEMWQRHSRLTFPRSASHSSTHE